MARTPQGQKWKLPVNTDESFAPGDLSIMIGTATISSGSTTTDVSTNFGGNRVVFAAATPVTVTGATLGTIEGVGCDLTLSTEAVTFGIAATLGSDLDIRYFIAGYEDIG